MIKAIKLIHTAVWAVMASAVIYVLYAGLAGTFNALVLASIILVILESVVLVWNKWTCPLTPLAAKYTADRNPNFDIYLPRWLAKHNKTIFTAIFVVGLVLTIINLAKNQV